MSTIFGENREFSTFACAGFDLLEQWSVVFGLDLQWRCEGQTSALREACIVWQGERDRDGNPNPNPKSDLKPPSEVLRSPPSALSVFPSYSRSLYKWEMNSKRAQEIDCTSLWGFSDMRFANRLLWVFFALLLLFVLTASSACCGMSFLYGFE
jgi:hypothetical protein